jgi:transcriptional antiterminator NusG
LDFEFGEEVWLTEGRYASMRGVIDEINEARGKVRVVINMFGRPVPTELAFHQVEKLS